MAAIAHIAVEVFLAMLRVFMHFAILLFTSIVGVLLLVCAVIAGAALLFGGVGFSALRRRR